MYHKNEVTAILALVFTLISTFIQTQSSAKQLQRRSAPTPQRFFPQGSSVWDFYYGHGADILTLTSTSEVLLLMYYAPWSQKCQEIRYHIDKLSRHFSPPNQVRFVGVNCWDPGGRCKQNYKLYLYPVISVYVGSPQAIFYTGLLSTDYIYRFLENVLDPMERLQSGVEIEDFLASGDACLVAYFDFKSYPDPPGYLNYHRASLKYLERDPMGGMKFGVITEPELASQYMNMTTNKEIRLYQLRGYYDDSSDFLSFPSNRPFKSSEIVNWAVQESHFKPHDESLPLVWLPSGAPIGQKSEDLQEVLRKGPTVLLFTPRDILLEKAGWNPDHAVFRQVALEYMDCTWGDGARMRNARSRAEKLAVQKAQLLTKWRNQCKLMVERERRLKDCCKDVVMTTVHAAPARNICEVCNQNNQQNLNLGWGLKESEKAELKGGDCSTKPLPSLQPDGSQNLFSLAVSQGSCTGLSNIYPASSLVNYCCHPKHKLTDLSVLNKEVIEEKKFQCDSECLKERERLLGTDGCQRLRLAKRLGYNTAHSLEEIQRVFDSKAEKNFYGIGCETNRTLRFVALDSRHFSWLADKFPDADYSPGNNSKAVIVENSTESIHVLSGPFTASKLREFLYNFTKSYSLPLSRRSETYTPSSFSLNKNGYSIDKERSRENGISKVSVQKLTTKNFVQSVMDPDRDVVVLYTGGAYCGFCTSVFHTFLSAASYFKHLKHIITFAKIDINENDVPWEYSVDRTPSIIIYPRMRKGETVMYPEFLPHTLPNLLSFLLAETHPEVRWRTALNLCSTACLERNRRSVLQALDSLRKDIPLLKAQLRGTVSEIIEMESYNSLLWDVDDHGEMFLVFARELRKDLARKETQRKILRTFLNVLHKLSSVDSKWSFEAKDKAILDFLVKNSLAVPN